VRKTMMPAAEPVEIYSIRRHYARLLDTLPQRTILARTEFPDEPEDGGAAARAVEKLFANLS
jgi:hypothetical protein